MVAFLGGGFLTTSSSGSSLPSDVTSDGVDFVITPNSSPTVPATGKIQFGATDVGGRILPSFIGELGAVAPLQPSWARKSVGMLIPNGGGSATMGVVGIQNGVATGTATGRTPASTNLFTGTRRLGYVSAAGAGSAAGVRTSVTPFWLGNAAGAGGFHVVMRFGISDAVIVAGRQFCGLQASSGAPTDVNPSTFANMIGIGSDSGDTVMQLYASGAAAQARTSLGANFPVNTTNVDLYELALYAAPNASQVTYRVERINTGHTATGTISAGASLPANTTFLAAQMWRANGGVASAVGIDILQAYFESDY